MTPPPPSRVVHPMVSVPDALRIVLTETAARRLRTTASTTETLAVSPSLAGRTLAQDVTQRSPGYPPYRASIMDGYAIHSSSMNASSSSSSSSRNRNNQEDEWTHAVVDRVLAGDQITASVTTTTATTPRSTLLPPAHYVTTGAIVPDEYDCVVPIEVCRVSKNNDENDKNDTVTKIAVQGAVQPHQWIRPPGCDLAPDTVVLPAGHVLDGIAMGLLLQSGVTHVTVRSVIQVGILSTGNELDDDEPDTNTAAATTNDDDDDRAATTAAAATTTDAWTARPLGSIPDVNRPILLNLVQSWDGVQVVDLGICRDEHPEQLAARIKQASDHCHVLITTGGISVGDADLVEQVLLEDLQAKLHFGRLHMKPGKPTTFFTLPDGPLIFSLPGNPVSAVVCSHLLVQPCLHLLFHGGKSAEDDNDTKQMVENAVVQSEVTATLTHPLKLDTERPEYARVTLTAAANGTYTATTTGVQRSSRLASLRDAQGLLVLPQGSAAKPVALQGEAFTVLILKHTDLLPQVTVGTSRHLNPPKQFSVRVLVWSSSSSSSSSSSLGDCTLRVSEALEGSKKGSIRVLSQQVFTGATPVVQECLTEQADFSVILSDLPWKDHTAAATQARAFLSKPADALALQIRQGAAAQEPEAALYEVVVGYDADKTKSLVVFLSNRGWEGGLSHVRGLLKHAVQIAHNSKNVAH